MTKRATTTEPTDAAPTRRAQPIDDILDFESFLSFRVSVLAKLLDRRLGRLVGEQFGLALAEYRVLAQVTMRPKSTVRDVAARTFVDKAQVSRAVAVLEEHGLIGRTMSGTDRRSPEFTTTRAGRALMNKIIPLRRAQEDELTAQLGRADLAALTDACQRLIERFADPDGVQSSQRGDARSTRTRPPRPS